MIQHVDKYPIYSIFDKESKVYYFIPKYQRAYTWSYTEWGNLFDDLYENNEGYFIGTIICINQGDSIQPFLEVIDGQQRLTTISLLLAAVYTQLSMFPLDDDDDYDDTMSSLKRSIRCKTSPNQMRLVPQIQENNLDDYNQLMGELDLRKNITQRKPYFPLRKIYRCYKYFQERLTALISEVEGNEAKTNILLGIYDKIKSAMVVKIEVSSHSDAYVLFESLNNRGTPLTAIDLMKNLIMAKAEGSGMSTDDCFEQWRTLLDNLSDNYQIQERFFRQYYNAFRKSLNKPFEKKDDKQIKYPLGSVATKSNMLSIYERIIKRDLSGFLDEITLCGSIYSKIVFPQKSDIDNPFADNLLDLLHIQGAPSYILLLYLLRNKVELDLNDRIINSIVAFLSKFFVHRNVTDFPNTRDLARLFMEIISKIEDEKLQGAQIYDKVVEILRSNCLDDSIFEERLRGNLYKENVDATRFLLCSLAEHTMTNESNNNLWDRYGSGNYIWTIEHIFPEGENVPQEWVDMIADGDKNKAKEYLDIYAHKLGNLTMTGYNSTLSNLSFEKKRDRTDKQGKYVGYKNNLSINEDLANKEKWTIEDIQQRTDKLVEQLLVMYKL
jgi:uncharacterized protein with ParB-like and HNH nuclease domain